MTAEYALAQLRHAYAQCLAGEVRDIQAFARGLLGPAIVALEVECARRPHAEEVLKRFEEWATRPYVYPSKRTIRDTMREIRQQVAKEAIERGAHD